MKAVQMTAVGGPEVLRYVEVSDPVLGGERDLLVKVKASGINPVDAKQRGRGTWYPSTPPVILGIDGAGIVEKTGAGVKRFRPGDEVYFAFGGYGKEPGTYAQYAVVDERLASRKPKCVSFNEAGAAASSLITAWECLFDQGGLKKNETVLIQAGAGGVGHLAVQLARQTGARVCVTVNSREKADLAKKLGAEEAILYEKTDFVKAVLDWTGGKGVDCAIDLVGGETFFKTFAAVRFYGRIVTLLGPDPKSANWTEARMRNLVVGFYLMISPMYYGLGERIDHQTRILDRCTALFAKKRLAVHVGRTFPLAEAAEAHRFLEKGEAMGKIVLTEMT